MLLNVSTLLGEPVGARRRHKLDRAATPSPCKDTSKSENYSESLPAWGSVELMRTSTGVLVSARLTAEMNLQCARCLTRIWQPIEITFDEEFVPENDPQNNPQPTDTDPDAFRIDERQHLDLSEAIRQYAEAAQPISPICQVECAGLCPRCGSNRNEGACGCPAANDSSRWAALSKLASELKQEEDRRGAPQA